jgi:hypothetical protein
MSALFGSHQLFEGIATFFETGFSIIEKNITGTKFLN